MEPLVILGAVSSVLSFSYALYKHAKFEQLQNDYNILQDRNERYVGDLVKRSERICELTGENVELKSKLQNRLDSNYGVSNVFTTEKETPRVKSVVEQRTTNTSAKSSDNSGSRGSSFVDYVPIESYSYSDSGSSYSDCSSSSSCDSGSCCSD